MNPSLGRNFEAMDLLERLARLADHIPDPGRHRTHFYAHYANRVRGERPDEETGRRCSPSWARLIAKVFQVDPLVCRRCAGPLKVVAYITDSLAIRQILEHLDLSPPEKPPPDICEVVRVPVDELARHADGCGAASSSMVRSRPHRRRCLSMRRTRRSSTSPTSLRLELQGVGPRVACPQCRQPIEPGWRNCARCGAAVVVRPEGSSRP